MGNEGNSTKRKDMNAPKSPVTGDGICDDQRHQQQADHPGNPRKRSQGKNHNETPPSTQSPSQNEKTQNATILAMSLPSTPEE
jgi:hypothetical protein